MLKRLGASIACIAAASLTACYDSSNPSTGDTGVNSILPPMITPIEDQFVDEDSTLVLPVKVAPSNETRVWVEGLPPGAVFDERGSTITFTPDFIQGGSAWTVTVHAWNTTGSASTSFEISAQDTISPPVPRIVAAVSGFGYKRLEVEQTTDTYLDSSAHVGRSFQAQIYVPTAASDSQLMPVQIFLHGADGFPYIGDGTGDQFRIYPHDPMNTYWWGYVDDASSNTSPTAPNYTQRRVLHLVQWVLRTFPGADPERVYVSGASMGGAGAATLGLLYARHFAFAETALGQMIPRNHRPDRLTQLEGLWGKVSENPSDGTALENGNSIGVWDRQDISRILRDMPEARDQFVFTKHGKDDSTIHFGAVTHNSPLTERSYYESVQQEHVGHYAVWDEGGHTQADPVMGWYWWDDGFSLVSDRECYLRRDRPFPAFTRASHDWDPGDGTGNGRRQWSDNSGYAGIEEIAGDTGWSGDIAGVLNRFLRWDTSGIVDTWERFEISLFVVNGMGNAPPQVEYPSLGDRFDRMLPVLVDVTPRRLRLFRCVPGESVRWEFGGLMGLVDAAADGSVTVPQIPLDTERRTLLLTRVGSSGEESGGAVGDREVP